MRFVGRAYIPRDQTFVRLESVLDRRWKEEQCLGRIPYTSAIQVELRYLD